MRKIYFLVTLFLFLFISNLCSQNFPNVSLNSAHVRTITSNIIKGMEYELCIALPKGYSDTTMNYPVVYMLDGYEIFGLQLQTYQQLAFFETVPPLILVGINYKFKNKDFYQGIEDYLYSRSRDFTPTFLTYEQIIEKHGKGFASFVPVSGGGEKFLRFFHDELFPFIESEYRVDPKDRGILGYSLGGLFTTYVLFKAPESFQKIFIGSPALWWDGEAIYDFYNNARYDNLKTPIKVYLSVGELEGKELVESFEKLNIFLNEKQNPKINLISEILQGEMHLTGIGLAHSRAFRRLYGKP
ncbi:alpha/beta hydrolase [Calditrichota bacterium]